MRQNRNFRFLLKRLIVELFICLFVYLFICLFVYLWICGFGYLENHLCSIFYKR